MNTIHYIVAGAKSPQGRQTIQSLVARGIDPRAVTAIDVKSGSMSYGEDETLTVHAPDAYKTLIVRKSAQMILADARPDFIDLADTHLDDNAHVLDLTGHFLNDPDAVLAPNDGMLVVQPSVTARITYDVLSALPHKPDFVQMTVLLPASHFGKDGMDELYQQVRQFLVAEDLDNSVFTKKLAFNILPFAGTLDDDGAASEETRLYAELRHLMPDTTFAILTAVAPVFIGTTIAVTCRFDDGAPTPREALLGWHRNRGIRVIDPGSELAAASPAEIAGDDLISISRVHAPGGASGALSFWITGDNTLL